MAEALLARKVFPLRPAETAVGLPLKARRDGTVLFKCRDAQISLSRCVTTTDSCIAPCSMRQAKCRGRTAGLIFSHCTTALLLAGIEVIHMKATERPAAALYPFVNSQ
jgi:hypothetical protein